MKNKNTTVVQDEAFRKNAFIKLCSPSFVKDHIKEARRVGYIIDKDDMSYCITDDETFEIVERGIRFNSRVYAVHFNKAYWVDDTRPVEEPVVGGK